MAEKNKGLTIAFLVLKVWDVMNRVLLMLMVICRCLVFQGRWFRYAKLY